MNFEKFRRIKEDKELSPAEKLVMIYILDYENGDEAAYPLLATLSEDTNLHKTTISAMTTRLRAAGKLVKKRRAGSSLYIVYPTKEEQREFPIEKQEFPIEKQEFPSEQQELPRGQTDPLTDPPTKPPTHPSAPTAADKPPTPVSFNGWLERLRNPPKNNRVAVLANAFVILYPDLGPPDFPMIGKTAKNLKAGSTLLRLLWEIAPSQPNCVDCKDLMLYLQAVHRNRNRRQSKETPRAKPQPKADRALKRQLQERKEQRATDKRPHNESNAAPTPDQ